MTLESGFLDVIASVGLSILTKATLILLVTLAAVRFARHSRASVRHLLLAAGFAVLLALPLAVVFAPSLRVAVRPVPLVFEKYMSETALIETLSPSAAGAVERTISGASRRWSPTTAELLTAAWTIGVVLFALPVLVGLAQVRRLRRTGLPWMQGQRVVDSLASEAGFRRPMDVVLHESVAAPATCGAWRHTILFPLDAQTWPREDVVHAAVHEVEHARRADCVIHAGARVVCAAYWFHPLVWIAWRRLGLEAERACDDAVLRRADADVYADQLVTLAGRLSANTRHPLLAMANRSDLVERVTAVLDRRQARGDVGLTVGAVIALSACVLLVTLSPLQAVSGTREGAAAAQKSSGSDGVAQFEVATIRTNRSGEPRARHTLVPASGQLTITNVTVSQLIQDAYGVQMPSLVVNMPEWARSQRVDVVAKAASPAPAAALQRMLQPLVAEYFKLAVRRETRELDVLALAVAAPGRLGPQLRKSDAHCDDVLGLTSSFSRAPQSADPSRLAPPKPGQDPSGGGGCGILPGGAGRIVVRGLDMAGFVDFLATNRLIIDRTGLTGRFDIDLTYTPEAFSAAAVAQRPGARLPPGVDPSGPPLATALEDQLGLKLEAVRAPVEVLVIEHAEPLAAGASSPAPAGQASRPASPAFDVASIRQNTSSTGAPTTRVEGGRYVASNVALQLLISDAYRLPIVGGPEWLRHRPGPQRTGTRFDVIATIPPGTPPAQVPLMLRTLLADRFTLVVHTETQEREAYALVHAREDGRLGPQLTPSRQQCQVEIEAGPLRAPVRRVTDDGKPVCSMMQGPAAIRGGGLTMRFLASALTGYAGRMVVDRTGLEGPFDFELTYAPAARGGGPAPPDDRPSIFIAVQEQLGLKLEPTTAAVDVLVIDSVSMPTEN